eukprot:jgi/Chrzof1/6124/Cz17g10190.t1
MYVVLFHAVGHTPSSAGLALLHKGVGIEAKGLAASTKSAYSMHVVYFLRFLLAFGWVPLLGCFTNPSEGVLYSYVVFLSATCSHDTIRNYIKGVKYFLVGKGYCIDWSHYVRVQRLMKGIKRMSGVGQHAKSPITLNHLLLFAHILPAGSFYQCLLICMVIGVLAMLRRSNLVPGCATLWGQAYHLCRKDITVDTDRYALKVQVSVSKTLTDSHKVHCVWIAGMRGYRLDPVQLYVNYVAAHPAPADAPAFLFDRNGSLEPLSFELLTAGLKRLAALAGMDAARYASHSLRKGGARAALAAGLNDYYTMFQGDWASNCFQRYYSMSVADKINITRRMLHHFCQNCVGSRCSRLVQL